MAKTAAFVGASNQGGTSRLAASSAGENASSTTSHEPCPSGAPCACDNGLIGRVECDGSGAASCTCDACELPDPKPQAFEACGGEPFGTWVLSEIRTDDMMFRVGADSELDDYCAAEITHLEAGANFRLQLLDG